MRPHLPAESFDHRYTPRPSRAQDAAALVPPGEREDWFLRAIPMKFRKPLRPPVARFGESR